MFSGCYNKRSHSRASLPQDRTHSSRVQPQGAQQPLQGNRTLQGNPKDPGALPGQVPLQAKFRLGHPPAHGPSRPRRRRASRGPVS